MFFLNLQNNLMNYELILQVNSQHWIDFLHLAYVLYIVGITGIIFNYKNFLITMLSIELMYLGIVTSFIITSVMFHEPLGQIYALIFLILAASESAVGLGLLIVLFRYGRNINFSKFNELRG